MEVLILFMNTYILNRILPEWMRFHQESIFQNEVHLAISFSFLKKSIKIFQGADYVEETMYLTLGDLALIIRKIHSSRRGWWCSLYFLLSLPEYRKENI